MVMKRKAHSKSRNGCRNCKRRHVKCDEQGPPCLNCVVRETQDTCTYSQPPPQQQQQTKTSTTILSPGLVTPDGARSSPDGGRPPRIPVSPAGSFLSPSSSRSLTSSTSEAAAAEARRLMDVELMHRWSTVTYKSFVSIAEDRYYLQTQVPLAAFKHEYLLNGLLALTALERALTEATDSTPPPDDEIVDEAHVPLVVSDSASSSERPSDGIRTYVRAGLDYYGRAIRAFREKLCGTLGPEDQHPLFFMAMVAPLINLIIPRSLKLLDQEKAEGGRDPWEGVGNDSSGSQAHSTIAQALGIFELFHGLSSIMRMDWSGILNSPAGPSITAALKLGPPDFHSLDPDTDEALNTLMAVAASLAPATSDAAAGQDPTDQEYAEHRSRGITAPAEEVMATTDFDSLHDGRLSGSIPEPRPSLATTTIALELRGEIPQRTKAEKRRDMYMNEVFYLRYCFAETQRAAYKFSGMGWPCMGGHEFTRDLARREPLALLLLAFWGVLIGRESNSTWWTGSIGADLVAEISEALVLLEMRGQLGDGFARMPEWRSSVSWTRTQIGLTAIS
ncbi:hypothetical protein MGG_04933 [Pyricularia oryzae 70-15]|uniref:Zn(2)-C6 fungal-type domain-containing protein n=1 Tax=Pyricularia oryzae (strain 70-15 / ATCC MYA-4617 / FGSC 8958) TaxID=242507 RepID=G4N362_PYRO7|nr:uncharacterized protein MGG_04933 [Pyricularia oryzae 70-15]EHA52618.1 hypothetical protein MGG_04933 [Pyricularia oryzae 70-15]KAI7930339.1 hypothetical protein M9X92_000776 [Pyricularia oryzae]KAI7932048.1 hypothetical protein M0657_000773 [Pyricularia oryzae]